jgi:hypothetical protein
MTPVISLLVVLSVSDGSLVSAFLEHRWSNLRTNFKLISATETTEEKSADAKLTQIAETVMNAQARRQSA